jgi:CBS domain-containing protein
MAVPSLEKSNVVAVLPDTTVEEVIKMMDNQNIGSVVVLENEEPVGIVTDRDLVLKVLKPGKDRLSTVVGEVMTEDPVTLEEGMGFFVALRTMSEHEVRRLPIVDAEGKLIDIVSHDDLIRLLADELDKLADVPEAESDRDVRKYF